jgi:hypothetical protein
MYTQAAVAILVDLAPLTRTLWKSNAILAVGLCIKRKGWKSPMVKLEKDIALLEKALEHWYDNLRAAKEIRYEDIEIGCEECPLCDEYNTPLGFIDPPDDVLCLGCPVAEKTGIGACLNTPWGDVRYMLMGEGGSGKDLENAIQVEIDFLDGLLKEKLVEKKRERD